MTAHPHPPKRQRPAWNSVAGKVRCKHCRNGKVDFKVWTGNAFAVIPVDCRDCGGSGWLWPEAGK